MDAAEAVRLEQQARADPLLHVHRRETGEYSIAGKYNPASIKDQMVRAVGIVDRAVRYRIIGPNKRLLVVGAGAAGVSAAIRAADAQTGTTLVEREDAPLQRQGDSFRMVDPTGSDWPHAGWNEGGVSGLPLPLLRKPAVELVRLWLAEHVRPRDFLYFRPRTEFIRAFPDGASVIALLRGEVERRLMRQLAGDRDGGYGAASIWCSIAPVRARRSYR